MLAISSLFTIFTNRAPQVAVGIISLVRAKASPYVH